MSENKTKSVVWNCTELEIINVEALVLVYLPEYL